MLKIERKEICKERVLRIDTLTSFGIFRIEVPETIFTTITTATFDVFFTMTTTRFATGDRIGYWVAYTIVQGTTQIAVTRWKRKFVKNQLTRKSVSFAETQNDFCVSFISKNLLLLAGYFLLSLFRSMIQLKK